jgi:hypothetical protein
VEAVALRDWRGGAFLELDDAVILTAAVDENWVFVTYDLRTIVDLTRDWGELDRHHAGIIFVDDKSIPSRDVGGLLRALLALIARDANVVWLDRAVFLNPVV